MASSIFQNKMCSVVLHVRSNSINCVVDQPVKTDDVRDTAQIYVVGLYALLVFVSRTIPGSNATRNK